jgi:hypothetical protein
MNAVHTSAEVAMSDGLLVQDTTALTVTTIVLHALISMKKMETLFFVVTILTTHLMKV